MKKSRLLSLLLAAVMASLSLSACGGDTGDNTESSDAASSTESSAAEETSSEETQTTTGNGYAWEEDRTLPLRCPFITLLPAALGKNGAKTQLPSGLQK